MKITSSWLMASSASGRGQVLGGSSMVLLPPIPLYRRILRAHRKHLSENMRLIGDNYVKSEFRSHRNIENPVHIVGFLTEWQMYAQKLEGGDWIREKMDPGKIEKMSVKADINTDQQLGQIYELARAIRGGRTEDNDSNK